MSALHLASKEGLLEFVEAILAASNKDRRVKVNMTDVNVRINKRGDDGQERI